MGTQCRMWKCGGEGMGEEDTNEEYSISQELDGG